MHCSRLLLLLVCAINLCAGMEDTFLNEYDPYDEGDPRESIEHKEEDPHQEDEDAREEEVSFLEDNETYNPSPAHVYPADMKQQRWANAAYTFLKSVDCSVSPQGSSSTSRSGSSGVLFSAFTTTRECKTLQRLRKSDMNVYLADPERDGEGLEAVLPDDDLTGSRGAESGGDLGHDAVLVVDPYPQANFGHLVIVFYLDLNVDDDVCHQMGGQILAGRECLYLATKNRCKNILERRSRRRNFARRCEINFIPLVRLVAQRDSSKAQQRLTCRDNIPGWSKCPALRAINETDHLICNKLRDNHQRCETSHERIHTSCRVMEVCDQAVLLSGGWNRWTHRPYHRSNLVDMYTMLRQHGFLERNIKLFFANGDHGIDKGHLMEEEDHHKTSSSEYGSSSSTSGSSHLHTVYPSALKPALRGHIQKLCATPHCADSLLLYLNSPATSAGTSLLWDVDGDGVASDDEVYTLEELLGDTANCHANHLHIIVDQSYAGELARAVRRSKNHRNVAVFAGSKDNEYSTRNEFTHVWTHTNHTQKCAKQVFRDSKKEVRFSTPDLQEGEDASAVNIFGAPCDVLPPFTYRELQRNYLGCQNLPSALWVMKILSSGFQQPQTADAAASTSTGTQLRLDARR